MCQPCCWVHQQHCCYPAWSCQCQPTPTCPLRPHHPRSKLLPRPVGPLVVVAAWLIFPLLLFLGIWNLAHFGNSPKCMCSPLRDLELVLQPELRYPNACCIGVFYFPLHRKGYWIALPTIWKGWVWQVTDVRLQGGSWGITLCHWIQWFLPNWLTFLHA